MSGTIRWRAWAGRVRIVLPVLAVASVLLALNIWAYRHMGRLDLTSAGVYTISDQTRKVLATVEQPVQVTWFYDLRNKSMVDALALLEQYARENPKIQVRGIDPTVHPAEARRYGIQFAGSAVFESPQRTLTVNGGMETDFTNAIIRTTTQTVQTVCFTHGHQEANPFSIKELDDPEDHDKDENLVARVEVHERNGMGMARDALETLGYKVRKVLLLQVGGQIDACSLIIVAGPKRAFRDEEVGRLRDYLNGGGKLMMLLEPGVANGMQAVLDDFGIRHYPQEVLDEGSHYRSDVSSPASSDYPRHRITRNLPLTFFPGTSSFTPADGGLAAGVSVAPLVLSSDKAMLKGVKGEPGNHTLMLLATRRLGSVPVPQGGKQATLLLGGDADFANNSYFALLGNGGLFINSVSYLAQQEQLIDIQPRHYEGASVQLTNNQMRLTFFVSSVLLPMLALLTGGVFWWRRR